jgi:hypothetical protein
MAEIRINATGGVKLYDADDSHYAQIVAGTITSNVDAITLGHNIATFNAAVTAGGVLKTDDTTEATSTTDGSLQTDGGLSVAKDTVLGDDLKLLSDSSVIAFGADGDTTLTHTDGTGLTLNSTNKLCFNDASQYIQGASNAILDIAATDEIELNATLVDINANVEISGTATTTGVHTFSATPVFPDGSLALADLDIDGGTDIGAAIVDADLFIVDDGAGGTNRKVTASRIKTYAGGGISKYFFVMKTYGNRQTDLADYTNTKITFADNEIDADSLYDGATNFRYTAPADGDYFFFTGLKMTAGNAELRASFIRIFKNGSDITIPANYSAGPGDGNFTETTTNSCSIILALLEDDYIEVFCAIDNSNSDDDNQCYGYFGGWLMP